MSDIFYKKNNNSKLFSYLEKNGFEATQNYIPIYDKFFDLGPKNYNNINLNEKNTIHKIIERFDNNNFKIECLNGNSKLVTNSFFKFSPLIDPVKFMVGKYGTENKEKIKSLPHKENNICFKKVLDENNSAYVDSFFYYLSSKLLNNKKFYHGTDFYGSFLSIQKKFNLNIFDDLEYLYDSDFFHKYKNKLFNVESIDEEKLLESDTRNYRKKIKLEENSLKLQVDNIDENMFNDIFKLTKENLDIHNNKFEEVYKNENKNDNSVKSAKKTESTCSSRSSNTKKSDNSELDDDITNSELSEYSSMEDEVVNATLIDFPVQIICIEKMENTLDYLMENAKKEMEDHEWRSCLFQVIMILITYQKVFDFVHNDLHTNNIMYVHTNKQFISYKYNNNYYRVPTYGKIFKIIDFGRATFKYKGKIFCSDSYHNKGDAATQYNYGPYYNDKKAILEPNKSFDLCRLACSIYDYFFDDVDDVEKECKEDPLANLIYNWVKDDKNRNILYKKNGEERYPEFKLYKMIVRTVHNKLPEDQLDNVIFKKYRVSKKRIKKLPLFNIDNLESLCN